MTTITLFRYSHQKPHRYDIDTKSIMAAQAEQRYLKSSLLVARVCDLRYKLLLRKTPLTFFAAITAYAVKNYNPDQFPEIICRSDDA